MIIRKAPCPTCGKLASVIEGQIAHSDHIGWFRSRSCEFCGARFEEDGFDTAEDVRLGLLDRDGVWNVLVESTKYRVLAYKIIRKVFKLTISETIKLDKTQRIVFSGTEIEANFVKSKLDNEGVPCNVERVNQRKLGG